MRKTTKLTTQDFRRIATKKHNNKYDYSLVEYKTNKDKVCIICPEHGSFLQQASSHMRGVGCRTCGYKKGTVKLSRLAILRNFQETHGDLYDYSLVAGSALTSEKVTIVCQIHGPFQQKINNHQQGQHCPSCTGTPKKTLDEVIHEFRKVHGDTYDYSKITDYKNANEKMCIVCPTHGDFWQNRINHGKGGTGCPVCAWEFKGFRSTANIKPEQEMQPSGVYLLKITHLATSWVKVGVARDVIDRVKRLIESANTICFTVEVVAYVQCKLITALSREKQILDNLQDAKYQPEIKFQGYTECLCLEALPAALYLFNKQLQESI